MLIAPRRSASWSRDAHGRGGLLGELVDLVEAPSGHLDDVVIPETLGRRPQPVEVDEPGKAFGHRRCCRDDLTAAHRMPDHPDRRARRRRQHPGELAEIERARAPRHPRRQPPRITVAPHIDRHHVKAELHQSRSEVVPCPAVVVGAMNQHDRWASRIAPAPCTQARPVHLEKRCPIGHCELVPHDRSSSQAGASEPSEFARTVVHARRLAVSWVWWLVRMMQVCWAVPISVTGRPVGVRTQ